MMNTMDQPYLSVVIPSYNEQKNISNGVINQVFEYLKQQDYTWEVIFSDDGSTDQTLELLSQYARDYQNAFLLRNIHAGKAPTVKSGMLEARGKWRLFTDFDQSTPISEITKLFKYAQEGYQVVIGSREIKGAQRDKEPLYRHVMGRGFNLLVQILAVPGIDDTQCGFKLFSAAACDKLFNSLKVYGEQKQRQDAFTGAFDVELLYLARKSKYQIKEVPIIWKHLQTNRVSPVKDSLRMLRDILKIRLADFQGAYRVQN